ncbi:Unannotated [Lentimonas sp. CC19]|nr:Unannotated [Lentimonas sp. CC19]CAA6690864.1 Unannotated [Lentimonas sp. CC10]CAA7068474.1 Unannotated [Lentimonas sp. CC11]
MRSLVGDIVCEIVGVVLARTAKAEGVTTLRALKAYRGLRKQSPYVLFFTIGAEEAPTVFGESLFV